MKARIQNKKLKKVFGRQRIVLGRQRIARTEIEIL